MLRLAFNQRQLDAYCDGVFDHRLHLDASELRYVHHALSVIPAVQPDDAPISWKTFGHKVSADGITGYQLGLGFGGLTSPDREAIAAVLTHWLGRSHAAAYDPLLATSRGAGVGWVFPTGERRLYFYRDVADETTAPALSHISLPEHIVGFSFRGAELFEKKVYYYPEVRHWPRVVRELAHDVTRAEAIAARSLRLALVTSASGAPRLQLDVDPSRRGEILDLLASPVARELADRCKRTADLDLDTVALTASGLGLYFD